MRTNNSLKNLITTIVPFVIVGLLGFVRVKFFVTYLGEDITSVNQLFYNILAYLSLAEGGIGLFIIQKYYKCFVEDDKEQINLLYSTSKIYFRRVAYVILGIGFIVSFFLPLFTKASLSSFYLQLVFMLFLFKNVIDYFMSSPRLIIDADQKMYKINVLINLIRILEIIVEIILVYLGFNYLVILIPGIFIRIIINIIINKKIYKLYPWIEDKKIYNKSEIKGMNNLINQKISGLIYSNTDILIVSTFLEPVSVIVYSSYNYVTKYLCDIGYMIAKAISSSMGNVLHKEKVNNQFNIFEEANILFYFIASLFTSLFLILINPFINLWMGEKYYMSRVGIYLIAAIMFFDIARRTILMTKDNLGLFKETKRVILLEAILNLLFSIILINLIGLSGVLLATVISTTITSFWYIPYFIYKNHFKKNVFTYYFEYLISLIICYVFPFFFKMPVVDNYFIWFVWAVIYGIIVLILLFIIYYLLFSSFRRLCEKGKYFLMHRGGKK